jgi:hypothetical protein
MGRGPQESIMRKLIRNYFKFDLKKKGLASASRLLPELQDAWAKYGIDSKEAQAIQDKIDAVVEKDEKDYIALKKSVKKYPILMNQYMQQINKPKQRTEMKLPYTPNKVILDKEDKDPFKNIKF